MAKPSVTNIRPPTTPPQTAWDLNLAANQLDPNYHVNTGSSTDAFDTSVATLNIPAHGPAFNLQDYNYVFFGVNGGMDETVIGNNNLSGVIVTGNGMDHVTGGQWDDIVFAGNGKDVVNGAGGNDILYGENGADQLNGNNDDGTASYTPAGSGTGPVFINPIADGTIGPGDGKFLRNGDYQDNQGSLQKVGFSDADGLAGPLHTFEIFQFDPGDEIPINQLNPVHMAAYIYEGGGYSDLNPDKIGDWTLNENQTVSFNVDLTLHPNGGHVVVFMVDAGGNATTAQLTDPEHNWLKSQAFESLADLDSGNSPAQFSFKAGDQLIGGNGPDQFIYDKAEGPNNVDLIWDYNQGNGTYDPLEGDVLVLKNTGITDVANLVTTSDYDVNGDGNKDLVIVLGDNHAIGLVGITDIHQVHVTFG
jgi:Ca2+-binding RTX toxin-like protein